MPIEEAAAAAAGGRLFVMGGFNAAGASLNTVYVFDGISWTSGPRLPLPLDHPSAATLDDHVYIAGGHSNGRDSARVFRLDGAGWTEVASMHFARGGHANTWRIGTSMPQPRNHVAGFALDNAVCVAGGRSPTTARVDCLGLATGVWSKSFGNLPVATSGGGAAGFGNGDVIVVGGQDASETRIVDQLVFARGETWVPSQKMLVPRHGFELAIFEGRAWACGGGSAPGLHPVATCTSLGDGTAALANG